MAGGGGTEAFPDLGKHCQFCKQLDFLPFHCDSCQKVYCLEHIPHKAHECQKSGINSRKVIVCQICSKSIETTGHDGEYEKAELHKHERSGDCDPKKKKKPTCPVKRCREALTFSNSSVCKNCGVKVCLNHRFPADHNCIRNDNTSVGLVKVGGVFNNGRFFSAFASRNAKDCAKEKDLTAGPSRTTPIKAH
ncbi:zinc finger AN1 domain-containing stress-associated protein 12 [Impatiens glandulifera]|uniref:zinc finger AN1 domain-containing stress-associated protein 12 n=1 Tax=Impatiens glandulifera TaxID=253017 RepID=UPI001FB10929|nr:zinc finger AN1 domain-containing stress-associated protein 12 [Impatiens glandulifera]